MDGRWTVQDKGQPAVVASGAEGKLGGISQAEEFLAAEREIEHLFC